MTQTKRIKNHHLPAYMPRGEDALVNWFKNYFRHLPAYIEVLQLDSEYVATLREMYQNATSVRNELNSMREYTKAVTELKQQLFYNPSDVETTIPRSGAVGSAPQTMRGGLVKLVDTFNKEKIMTSPQYNEIIAKALGLIPVAVPRQQVEPKDLKVRRTKITCDGSVINIRTPITKPATGQMVHVDKHEGKGWEIATLSEKANCVYYPTLPEVETLWTFKVSYCIKGKEVGTAAIVKVLVTRT